MDALTPAERRGALVVVLLLALGAIHDLRQASRPSPADPVAGGSAAARPGGWAREPRAGDPAQGDRVRAPAVATAVDLNRASASELESLPGVGPVLAGRIVAHRQRHGPFRHPEELLAVRGIGPRLLARLGPRVTVGPGDPRPAPSGTNGAAAAP